MKNKSLQLKFTILVVIFLLLRSISSDGQTYLNLEAAQNLPEGIHAFDFGQGVFQAYIDADGWMLWLQYHHAAGTNPNLNVISEANNLPMYDPSGLGTDNSLDSTKWGHGSQAFAASIPDQFIKLKWYGKSSGHNRIIHFESRAIGDFQEDIVGSFPSGQSFSIREDHDLKPDHTAGIPETAGQAYDNQGDYSLTTYPFFSGSNRWGVRAGNVHWSVDDNSGSINHTIHRVWVKYQAPPTYPFDLDTMISNGIMTLPIDTNGNPFLNNFFQSDHIGTEFLSGNRITDNRDLRRTAEAYCHPLSPYRGDTIYRNRLLYLLDTILYASRTIISTWDEQDIPIAYGLIKENFPNILSLDLTERCDRILKNTSLAYFEHDKRVWSPIKRLGSWYNGQANIHSSLFLIGVALNNDTIQYIGESFFGYAFTDAVLQNDGALDYTGLQNDVFTYRGFSTKALGIYHLVSRNQEVLNLWKKMLPYYPLSTYKGPTGTPMGEYYTAAFWKHYWNMSGPGHPYIQAALSNDPYNMDFAQNDTHFENVYYYKENLVEPVDQPESNYTIYDGNILGPRGRYGNFGFAGTARIVDNYANHLLFDEPAGVGVGGKSTLVGAHVIKESGGSFIYNAIIDKVGFEIKTVSGTETGDRRDKYLFLTSNEKSSTTNSKQLFGLTSTYNPSKAFIAKDWVMHEQWLFMPERIVGHLTVNSLSDNQEAFAIGSIVKLVAGRSWWGTKRDVVALGNGHYTYGKLHFIIKEQNLNGDTIIEYAPMYGETTASMSEKATYHRILDYNNQAGIPEQTFNYSINDKFYFTIEIFEEGTDSLHFISSARDSINHILTIDDGKRKLKSVMNITEDTISYQANIDSDYSMAALLRSWHPEQNLNKNLPYPLFSIPAHQSILIIESSDSMDVDLVENYFPDIFTASEYCLEGSPCDDGDPCSTNDIYNSNCECAGTQPIALDTDNDGICDYGDICPNEPNQDCFSAACLSYIIESNNSNLNSGIFKVFDFIRSNGIVSTTTSVSFQAENYILLNDGFEVKMGGDFEAKIDLCNP